MNFKTPIPDTQISFCQRLEELKKTTLQEALYKTVEIADIGCIDEELRKYVKNNDLQLLARHGIRGEVIFVVPYILKLNPRLIGYYLLIKTIQNTKTLKKILLLLLVYQISTMIIMINYIKQALSQ